MSGNEGRGISADEKQRAAERGALRDVRGALDDIEREERKTRRLRRLIFIIAGALLVLLVAYFAPLFMKSKSSGAPPAWPQLQHKQ